MKAIQIAKQGGVEELQMTDVGAVPRPGAGQALVRIHAAGVNFVDIYQRRGYYPMKVPFIPGLEAAGVVEAVGEQVADLRVGDRVAYAGHLGSYAEYTTIEADKLIPLPDSLSFVEGAAFPLQGITAHYLIHEYRTIKPGHTVLVHAAAGGVGGLLVQWAKHLGATVIGTAGSEEKAAVARAAGADHVILYTQQDFAAEVKRLTNGRGAELILDGVAKSTLPGDLEAAASRGYVVIYGAASGAADPLVPNSLMPRSLSLSGGHMQNFMVTREELLRRTGDVLQAIRVGWLKLRIDSVLPLADAEKAHRRLEGRQSSGKIVLQVVA